MEKPMMNESELTTIEVPNTEQAAPVVPKLYAGKFKSVEDLENGYKQSLPLYQKNQELESQIKQHTYVPEDYKLPENVKMRDTQINELKKLAKNAGLNEDQFSRAALSVNDNIQNQMKAFEERQKSVGEEKMNLTKSFVDKRFEGFSDDFKTNVLNQIIMDDNTMNDALRQREQDLNTAVPGSGRTSTTTYSSQYDDARTELGKLGIAAMHKPNDMKIRAQYIAKAEEVGHYRKELSNK
jgi:hypothetical protein